MTDIHSFLERYADDVFRLPYVLAQDAIGETDGGIASLFESDGRDYGSGFANAGGHLVIETIFKHFPSDEIVDRIANAETPEILQRFANAELLTKDAIPQIADDVTRLWHAELQRTFPEIASEIGDFSPSTARAVTKYLKLQHAYTIEHNQSFGPLAVS
ncbi:hypothetical protein G6L37_01555 [Agrobacterium rubi]|nr:hypothetical protein [Agrobacterium rubi]NTF24079.1 hypothetical protein [Agrobacterium rubi]